MPEQGPNRGVPITVMHLSFLLAGAGTLLIGPTLPLVAEVWRLNDSQSGALIAAQFMGAFTGAVTLSADLRATLVRGYAITGVSFLALAAATHGVMAYAAAALLYYLLGVGLGQVTTTVNLLSARRYEAPQQRSSALSLLNFSWSVGALLSPVIAGLFLTHRHLASLQVSFAAASLCLLGVVLRSAPEAAAGEQASARPAERKMATGPLLFFFGLFFLYGGLEATLSGWLSTYALRYTPLGLAGAAYCSTGMWSAFAGGRALAAALLRRLPEQVVRYAGVLLAGVSVMALRTVHSGAAVAACGAGIGLGIAPFFPVTFSQLIAWRPSARQAGAATANVGLGSAAFPFVTGFVSTHSGSLQTAMMTPALLCAAMFALCFVRPGALERRGG